MASHHGALPSEEKARFDRSERLWGAEAQKLLRSANVVLLGATATASEVMKNLVLPGLGHFTIIDRSPVTRRDLGNNFFLEQEDEGKPRAAAVVPVLAELNPLASGTAADESVEDVLADLPGFLARYAPTLVVASSVVTLKDLRKLGDFLKGKDIPLVYAASNGLVGVVRIQADPQFVLHTVPGPDTKVHDLRPLHPFETLRGFFGKFNPIDQTLDHHDFAHIPWFCVVYHALVKWRASNAAGKLQPTTGAEWKEVKKVIEGFAREDPVTKQLKLPDSFKDAMENCSARLDLTKRNTPELNAVLRDPRAEKPSRGDDVLWFLAHGLRRFREAHDGAMPVNGAIPDFECTTAMYRELQQIFRDQAARDAAEIAGYARSAIQAAGADDGILSDEMAITFSRQAWEVNYVSYPTLSEEFDAPLVPSHTNAEGQSALHWYAAYRASLIYTDRHNGAIIGRVASAGDINSTDSASLSKAASDLGGIVKEFWRDAPLDALQQNELFEWARFAGGEPVSVAAIVGAVASQECIKLIQKRRRPVCHTLVFDGIANYFTSIDTRSH